MPDEQRIPDKTPTRDNSQTNRYARQIQFASVGQAGHDKIAQSRVAILGCGALGTVAAEILARAGVGTLRLIDRDVVEWTNLQRQALYVEQDAIEGRAKAGAAGERLAAINSSIKIEPIVADVTSGNIRSVVGDVDLVIDAADNFAVRFLLNDWALATKTAWVHGGCIGANGQVLLFAGDGSPCFRCLVPEPPPAAAVDTCDTAGVLGSATHTIASLQASDAIKWLSGNRDEVRTTLLSIDLWHNRIRELSLSEDIGKNCPACSSGKFEYLDGSKGIESETAAALCGRDAVQISPTTSGTVPLKTIAKKWQGVGRIQETPFFVRLFPDPEHSVTLFRDGRVVISGTDNLQTARTLCDRYVGR
jgi:molybdopterin/thiamine biosynthesis adenylyltransferase